MSVKQEKLYTKFHGKNPKYFEEINIEDMSEVFQLGEAIAIEYKVAKHEDKKEYIYRHEFKKGARLFSNGKQLLVYGKKIKVTERGIVN